MEEIKTKDGVTVSEDRVDVVAMILSSCTEEKMEALGLRDEFQSLAVRFIGVVTDKELTNFVTHNAVIKLMAILS